MKGKTNSLSKTIYRLMVVMILVALLPGCSFGNLPTLSPTADTRPTFEVIQTQSAQTVVAELTRSAAQNQPEEATPTLVIITATQASATDTSVPTEVPTAIPTFTPI
ncbi:MAG: hypothetical protein IH586_12990, partial [Anaerolineaceae bacterium]|nr:hypothetical protein [Anaerolineaceae bacterium]